VLVQDPAAAAFSAKSLIGAPVLGAGTSDPITGTISLEGPSMVSSSLRAVLGPTSAPPTAIRYQWQRATPGSESFSDISGATGLANSPTAQDLGLSLRIQAMADYLASEFYHIILNTSLRKKVGNNIHGITLRHSVEIEPGIRISFAYLGFLIDVIGFQLYHVDAGRVESNQL
jgi:hypothetical protein